MAIDLMKKPLEILVDLINLTDGCAFTTSDISFGPVSTILNSTRNSAVTITATPEGPYTGSRNLTYNRIDLGSIPGVRSTVFDLTSAFTTSDLIAKINAMYRVNLQPEDYYNDALPDINDPNLAVPLVFTLRAKPASYIFIGSLQLTARSGKELLSEELHNDVLDGFYYLIPNPPIDPI